MITLFNPTNETLSMMFAGITYVMEPPRAPSHKLQVEDACGKHLLNAFAQRGLCQLVFGDSEELVARDGISRNLEFKKTQIMRYNSNNEQRKMQGLGYMPPTKELKRYSVELAIGLLEPYSMKDAELASIANARTENAALKTELETMRADNAETKKQLAELISLMHGGAKEKNTPLNKILEEDPGGSPGKRKG